MADLPLVSVIVPTLNSLPYLDVALGSALGQTYDEMEVVVVDGGSEDGTISRLETASDRYDQVSFEEMPGNQPYARNRAAEMAKGKFYAFLDSDDWWDVEKTAVQARVMQEEGVGWSFTGRRLYNRRYAEIRQDCPSAEEVRERNWYQGNPIPALSGVIMDADVFHEVGGFDTTLPGHDDLDLYIRSREVTNFAAIRKPLATTFRHRNQLTRNGGLMNRSEQLFCEKHGVTRESDS